MVDPQEHAKKRGWIESILRYIPGFSGYLEKEYRRDSDHLARTYVCDQLHKAKSLVNDYQKTIVNSGQIDLFSVCDEVVTAIDTLGNRIKGSVRGYSGFFDFVKVDEERLDRVYETDMKVITATEAFVKLAADLPVTVTNPREVVAQWKKQLQLIAETYDERAKILEGLDSPAA